MSRPRFFQATGTTRRNKEATMIKATTILLSWLTLASLLAGCSSNPVSPAPVTGAPIGSPVEFVSKITGSPNPLGIPTGVALDKQGNLYVMDTINSRVHKFDTDGNFLTAWGAQGVGDGQFNVNTHGGGRIAVDGQGNVYVADSSYRVQKFDSNGKFLLSWGSKGKDDGQFSIRMSVAVNEQGDVYVADDNHRIQKFDSSGKFLLKWGGRGAGDAELFGPVGLSVDEVGNVYVVEFLNGRIQKFDGNGKPLAKFFIEEIEDKFVTPGDIAVNSDGNLYVTDWTNNRIVKIDSSGKLLGVWGGPGSGDSQFNEPWCVAVDGNGNVYIADSLNSRIQKFRSLSLTPTVDPSPLQLATTSPTAEPTLTPVINQSTPSPSIPTLAPDEKLASAPEDIVGTWKGTVEGDPGYLIVKDDGTVNLAQNADGTSGNTHNYWFEGAEFNIAHELALHSCEQVGRYQIRVKQDGDKTVSLTFVLLEDPCKPRVRDLVNSTPVWSLPLPSSVEEVVFITDDGVQLAGTLFGQGPTAVRKSRYSAAVHTGSVCSTQCTAMRFAI
jgi:sugar lactone lactonase YvrE